MIPHHFPTCYVNAQFEAMLPIQQALNRLRMLSESGRG